MSRALAVAASLVLCAQGVAGADTAAPARSSVDTDSAHSGGSAPPEFHLLTLEQITKAALTSPRARAARWATRAAKARQTQARGAQYPKASITALAAPSPEIRCVPSVSNCLETQPTDVSINIQGVFGSAAVTLVQPLFTFGKIDAAQNAARAAVKASEHQEDALAGALVLEAAQVYFGLKLARELVWMLEDGQEEIDKAIVRLDERLSQGSPDVTVQDRLRIHTMRAEVLARLEDAREARDIALAALRALVDDKLADVDEDELTPSEHALGDTADAYAHKALRNRPELRAAQASISALKALGDLERARYFPDFALVATARLARAQGVDDPRTAFANDPFNQTSVGVGLVLSWDLDPVTQSGRVAQARAEVDHASALWAAGQRGVELDAQKAYTLAVHAHQKLEVARDGQKSARAWLASVLQADAIGTAESKDLADAYVAFFNAKARLLAAIMAWNVAVVDLGRTTGEYTAPE